ncbi:MAG: hypothetical protein P1V51_02205 [Deltaproteobacteria bacterium]|nr:hypothetical protein [Deltaproteobacteria bacterium]
MRQHLIDDKEDTNPGFRLRAMGPIGTYLRWTGAFGQYRRLFVPLGVLALLALGVHAAADRFDDWAFLLLDFLDRKLEEGYGIMARAFMSQPEERLLAFAATVDLEMKENVARWMALGVELLVDLRLGFGAIAAFPKDELGYVLPGSRLHHRVWAIVGRRLYELKRMGVHLGAYLKQPSVEKIYLPLAVTLAALAGSLALFVAVDNALFALSRRLPAEWESWTWLSPWPAAIASLTVLWRLGIPAMLGAMARCQHVGERDWARGESLPRRLLRGIFGAVLILPLLVAGLWAGTPLGRWVEQIVQRPGP